MSSSKNSAAAVAEKAVLGALIMVPDRIGEVRQQLHECDFTNAGHRLLWRTLLDLDAQRVAIDTVTIRSALEATGRLGALGGHEGLFEIEASVTSAAALNSQCQILLDLSTERRIVQRCSKAIAEVGEARPGLGEIATCLEQLERDLFEISSRKFGVDKIEPIASKIPQLIEQLLNQEQVRKLSTGLTDVDDFLHGLGGGEVCILAARTGRGKTLVGAQILLNVSKAGGSVLFVSLEMKSAQLIERLLCNVGQIDSSVMRDRRFLAPQSRAALQSAADRLTEIANRTMIIDKTAVTIDQLRAIARRARSSVGLDLIVVDYLQLMRAPGEESRWLEVSRISAGLKALAMEFDVPVLALAQLKREAMAKPRPDLSDLRESGSIEQDADFVILLSDGEQFGHDVSELVADVAKNRHGRTGDVCIAVEKQFFRAFDRQIKAEVVFDGSSSGGRA